MIQIKGIGVKNLNAQDVNVKVLDGVIKKEVRNK